MSPLRLYNSLNKKVESFVPQKPGKVLLYNCGPTVYKRQHLGNMRRFLFADFLRRSLEYAGLAVHEVTNITDVGHLTEDDIDAGEDKVEKAARQAHLTPPRLAEQQIALFQTDLKRLHIQPAHLYPRASEHILQMQTLITRLLEKKHAYQTKSGVYFDVSSFPAYGRLSGNSLEKIMSGHRIAVREEKKHPADFALWKSDDTHVQRWDSPWGVGYPGWHIECSAMSLAYLGPMLDIHTGGEDNRFPHHENEIAQSESANGQPLSRFWLHNAHLQVAGKKVSKRADEPPLTLDTLSDKGFSPLAFRLLVFSVHYRSKLDFSWEALTQAQKNLESFSILLRRLRPAFTASGKESTESPDQSTIHAFKAALGDDLNTPKALGVVMEYVRQAHKTLDANPAAITQIGVTLADMDKVLSIFTPLFEKLQGLTIPDSIALLVAEREQARQQGDYVRADVLRHQIEKQGYRIEDTPTEPRVTRQPSLS